MFQLDDGMGTPFGSNKATGNDDLMTFWMGIGSQIDGLGHMGENHVYYNGNSAKDRYAIRTYQVVHRQTTARCDSRRTAGYGEAHGQGHSA